MGDAEKFKQLVESDDNCLSIVTYEERYALEIVRNTALDLEYSLWIWSVAGGVKEGFLADSPYVADTESPTAGLRYLAETEQNSICVALDLAEHLKASSVLRALRDLINRFEQNGNTLVMVDCKDTLPEVVKSYSKPFEISFPSQQELLTIVRDTLQRVHRKTPIEIGITKKGLDTIVRNLRGLTRRQAERIIIDTVADDRCFDDNDINRVIASKRGMIQRGGLLEYVETPLDLSEIGGMRHLKKWLNQRKGAFSTEAEQFGLQAPKGVLMLGVQGAGKSLCAKAIATAWHQPLLRLDPGALYASFIGESERNLRDALRQTEMMSPVVLWIDEIEKAFASAASRSADGGLSQRMFGTLLTWMQEHEAPVFVVATANDIGALPPELLRKGRFDEIFFVDLPSLKVRKDILAIHLLKRKRDPEKFDLGALARASAGYSGSEIEQAVVSALHEAYSGKTGLSMDLILSAIKNSPPISVTMAESVQGLRAWAKDRCVPAD
jgi:hypothetical protein